MIADLTQQLISRGSLLLLSLAPVAIASDPASVSISRFSESGLQGWQERVFSGSTNYEVVATNTGKALHAVSEGSASARYRPMTVNLNRTPCLRWRWRISNIYEGNESERRKTGDDYPARVYVIFDTGLGWWNRRALNYVWSSHQPVGSEWPNAYTSRAHMIAVESGQEAVGTWREHTRDVVADYRRVFGDTPPRVEAVAVMTDSDDLSSRAEAWYADIHFLARHEGECGPP